MSSRSVANYRKCSWLITTAHDHKIKLKFTTFQLFWSFWSWGRLPDLIHVYDSKTAEITALVGVYTGIRRPFVVQSSGRFMLITLTVKNGGNIHNLEAVYTSTTGIGRLRSLILTDIS